MKGFTLCLTVALVFSLTAATTPLPKDLVSDLNMVNTIYRDYFTSLKKGLYENYQTTEKDAQCFGSDMLDLEKSIASVVVNLMENFDLSVLPQVMQIAMTSYSTVEQSIVNCGLFELAEKLDRFCDIGENCELQTIGKNFSENMFFIMSDVTGLMNLMEAEPEVIGGKVGEIVGKLIRRLLNYKE